MATVAAKDGTKIFFKDWGELMLKTPANPGGLPKEVFDGIRKGVFDNRSQFIKDLSLPFYAFIKG